MATNDFLIKADYGIRLNQQNKIMIPDFMHEIFTKMHPKNDIKDVGYYLLTPISKMEETSFLNRDVTDMANRINIF